MCVLAIRSLLVHDIESSSPSRFYLFTILSRGLNFLSARIKFDFHVVPRATSLFAIFFFFRKIQSITKFQNVTISATSDIYCCRHVKFLHANVKIDYFSYYRNFNSSKLCRFQSLFIYTIVYIARAHVCVPFVFWFARGENAFRKVRKRFWERGNGGRVENMLSAYDWSRGLECDLIVNNNVNVVSRESRLNFWRCARWIDSRTPRKRSRVCKCRQMSEALLPYETWPFFTRDLSPFGRSSDEILRISPGDWHIGNIADNL